MYRMSPYLTVVLRFNCWKSVCVTNNNELVESVIISIILPLCNLVNSESSLLYFNFFVCVLINVCHFQLGPKFKLNVYYSKD